MKSSTVEGISFGAACFIGFLCSPVSDTPLGWLAAAVTAAAAVYFLND